MTRESASEGASRSERKTRAKASQKGPRKGSKQHGRVGYSFSSPMRDARIARGLTLADIAGVLKVSTTTVRRAEFPVPHPHVSKKTLRAIERVVRKAKVKEPETAGEAIRAARLRARLTIGALAELTGVSAEHISRAESDTYSASSSFRARAYAEIGLDLRRFYPADVYPRAFGATEPFVEVLCAVGADEDPEGVQAPETTTSATATDAMRAS